MLIQQIWGGTVHWTQLPVYLIAELLAGAAAAGAFVAISRTPADAQVPDTVADLVPAEA
jgi:glycerol uptake facilitator protein